MTALFEYAVLQAVPRAERGESINVGVVEGTGVGSQLKCRHRIGGDEQLVPLSPIYSILEDS